MTGCVMRTIVAHMTHDWARGDTNHNWQAGH